MIDFLKLFHLALYITVPRKLPILFYFPDVWRWTMSQVSQSSNNKGKTIWKKSNSCLRDLYLCRVYDVSLWQVFIWSRRKVIVNNYSPPWTYLTCCHVARWNAHFSFDQFSAEIFGILSISSSLFDLIEQLH